MMSSPALPSHRPDRVPEGYEVVTRGSTRALVWSPAASWLDSVLAAGEGLHEWASGREDRAEFPGRGRVFSVAAPVVGPGEAARWAVRHYQRGGAMAMHMEDRYLRVGRPRPWHELSATITARARSIPTPAPVCGIAYTDGRFYTADFVTEEVPGGATLADTLFAHDGTRGWLEAMARAGALIRRLADAGVFHVDLNARNILMTEDPEPETYVIDLDRARILPRARASTGDRMRARLIRSIVKIGTPTGEHLAVSEIEAALMTRPGDLG